MEILWKGTFSAQFLANPQKLFGNCSYLQNFHTRKLGEITVFFAVKRYSHQHVFEKIFNKIYDTQVDRLCSCDSALLLFKVYGNPEISKIVLF